MRDVRVIDRHFNENGEREIPCLSMAEAERAKYLMEQCGNDARIVRDPLRVVATKKAEESEKPGD